MSKFLLDFNIYYAEDRLNAIRNIDLASLSPLELETVTNYVLYGKDKDDSSSVDRKEIQIKTKFSSYQKERTTSLDELMESPTFDENILLKNKNNYKVVKPKLDPAKAALIPGMKELQEDIAKLDDLVKNGKMSPRQRYLLKHHLIQIRSQQYYLYDSKYPTYQIQPNRMEYHTSYLEFQGNYPILPRGVMREENDMEFRFPRLGAYNDVRIYTDEEVEQLKGFYIDFRNTEHLYQLIINYEDLKVENEARPDSPIHNLLWTLDFYIEKANLTEQQLFIVNKKKKRYPNKDISAALLKELGISHQENYVSSIWNRCLKLIAEAVELNYDEFLARNYDKAWKVCNKCGRELLRDNRNFVKKSKAADGLTSRCKQCDKLMRKGGKVDG